jgi:hypothetical protein
MIMKMEKRKKMVVVILSPRHHWISKGGTMIDYAKEVNDYGRKLEPVAK